MSLLLERISFRQGLFAFSIAIATRGKGYRLVADKDGKVKWSMAYYSSEILDA